MRAIGFLLIGLFVLAALIIGFVVLVSVSPMAALVLVALVVVVGVPAVLGLGLLVVIAESGDDGWSGPGQFFNWDTAPKIRDRWPRDEL